jgi:hypothetical protein
MSSPRARDAQSCVLQPAPELIVACNEREILLQAETVQRVGDRAESNARVAALDRTQGWPRHAGALRDELRREPASPACESDVLAELAQKPRDRR